MKRGKLYAVGIGPGDPELMTLKAVRVIKEADVVCVPRGKQAGESMALGIVEQAVDLDGKQIIEAHFPMVKGSQREALKPVAEELIGVLQEGKDIAFITIGDPVLYSTFFHLYDAMLALEHDLDFEIIPGVSSVTASAARAGIGLALSGEKVAVVPATYVKDFEQVIKGFDTVVLMKVHRVIDEIKETLSSRGLTEGAVYVARAGLPDEIVKPLAEVGEADLDYFSIVIVRAKNG